MRRILTLLIWIFIWFYIGAVSAYVMLWLFNANFRIPHVPPLYAPKHAPTH